MQPALDYYNDHHGTVLEIEDADALLTELCIELNREEEDGTTLLHLAFDKALENAIENGAFGISEESFYRKKCPECWVNTIGSGESACPGCEAYRDHTA